MVKRNRRLKAAPRSEWLELQTQTNLEKVNRLPHDSIPGNKTTAGYEKGPKINEMTEVEVNGMRKDDLDINFTKAALSASSTSLRIGHLRTLEGRITENGKRLPAMCYSN